ncbi:MAG: DUF2059 domain-containing protein [Calditrichaeota bacterium]|nr:DUF2059 domain-containing protein [Calditrichota bacterium]
MNQLLVMLLMLTSIFSQEIDPKKEQLIRNYLASSGKIQATLDGLDQTLTTLKAVRSHVPASFWPEFKSTLLQEDLTITAILVKIYDAHFSTEELIKLNEFYKTELGKKLGKLYTKLSTESMIAGREWGQKVAARLEEELKKKGY